MHPFICKDGRRCRWTSLSSVDLWVESRGHCSCCLSSFSVLNTRFSTSQGETTKRAISRERAPAKECEQKRWSLSVCVVSGAEQRAASSALFSTSFSTRCCLACGVSKTLRPASREVATVLWMDCENSVQSTASVLLLLHILRTLRRYWSCCAVVVVARFRSLKLVTDEYNELAVI